MPFPKFQFLEQLKIELRKSKNKKSAEFELFSSLSLKEKWSVLFSILLLYYVLNLAIWFISVHTFSSDAHTLFVFFAIFMSAVSISEVTFHIFRADDKHYSWFIISMVVVGILCGGFFGYSYGRDIGFYKGNMLQQDGHWLDFLAHINFLVVFKIALLISAIIGTFSGISLLIKSVRTIHTQKTQREHEIELAQKIQEQLIPEKSIQNESITIHGQSLMAGEVGGDYFEIIPLTEERYILAVGDVAGHNIAAGLIMAMVKSALLTALHQTQRPDEILSLINSVLVNHSTRKHYVTFLLVLVDCRKKELILSNAGHLPLIEKNRLTGKVTTYKPKGIGLGISAKAQFETEIVSLKPNHSYLMLTDGLVEKRTKDGQMNGLLEFTPWLETIEATTEAKLRKELTDSFNEQMDSEKDDATFVVFSMPNASS